MCRGCKLRYFCVSCEGEEVVCYLNVPGVTWWLSFHCNMNKQTSTEEEPHTQVISVRVSCLRWFQDLKQESERIHRTNIIICTPGRLLQHMDETAAFHSSDLHMLGTFHSSDLHMLGTFPSSDLHMLGTCCSPLLHPPGNPANPNPLVHLFWQGQRC